MTTTPMMRQYQEAKRACPDALLLFRMGDFYEMFYDDAKTAARTLDLALTSRDKGDDAVPMAGFPHHQLESYLAKLIAAGYAGGRLRAGRRPEAGQGAGPARGDAGRHARHGDRRRPARSPRRATTWRRWRRAIRSGWPGSSFRRAGSWRPVFPPAQLADQLARIAPAECLLAEDAAAAARAQLDERMMVTRRPGWAFSLDDGPADAGEALRHGGPGGLRLRRRPGRRPGHPRRRRGPRLPRRDAEDLAGPHRPAGALPHVRHAGDRPGQPPQPGDHAARSARAAAKARCWPCWTARSRPWARGCWPIGWPIR